MKTAVLISGGVDSSVALFRLKEQGYTDLTAYYLKIWLEDEMSFMGDCPWETDLKYVREVCAMADVPLEVVSLQLEYYDRVVSYTVEELKKGRTPSPDIFCNQRIKFGAFFDRVNQDFDKVATGHYARVEEGEDGVFRLYSAPDKVKDQTYFLSHLSQEQIARIIFPIGDLEKSEVRELAEKYNLPNKDRKDSQGICFLGKIRYPDFVKFYLGEQEGDIINRETGEKLGTHKGFWFHTIGQRQGLGLCNGPWYVVEKDLEKNIIYVTSRKAANDNLVERFYAVEPNWLSGKPEPGNYLIKLRHGPRKVEANISHPEEGLVLVEMTEGDRGVAPGQFTVFYDGDCCLGGARIDRALDSV